jgi:hypothetical protein
MRLESFNARGTTIKQSERMHEYGLYEVDVMQLALQCCGKPARVTTCIFLCRDVLEHTRYQLD